MMNKFNLMLLNIKNISLTLINRFEVYNFKVHDNVIYKTYYHIFFLFYVSNYKENPSFFKL